MLEEAAEPPAPEPTQVVQIAGPGGKGLRVRRKPLFIGLGAVVVRGGGGGVPGVREPVRGSAARRLEEAPRDGRRRDTGGTRGLPEIDAGPDVGQGALGHVHRLERQHLDGLTLIEKSEDTSHRIRDSSAAEMYAETDDFKGSGAYELSMPELPADVPRRTRVYGRQAAENTVGYTTTDSRQPAPARGEDLLLQDVQGRHVQAHDQLSGKGDFTTRGREVARTAIANLDIDQL